ncbi:serine/threonine protein kinase [Aspergillus lentulus]|nr:serine/threonine protein kinase [Aspergillus lentulus]
MVTAMSGLQMSNQQILLISLLYGDGFHIFKPNVPADHDEYNVKILMKHYRCFGLFIESYEQIADWQ